MHTTAILIQFLTVITCLIVVAVIMFHKPFRGRHLFLLLCIAIVVQCYGYFLELTSTTLEAAIVAIKIEYLGIAYINILFLFFLFDYYSLNKAKPLLYPLLIFNTFVLLLVMTCDKHTLYYTSLEFTNDGIFPHVIKGTSLIYHIFQTEVLLINIFIICLLINRFIRCERKDRVRELHFIIAVLCICITCALNGFGVFNIYDPSTSSYVIAGLFMLIAIYKDQLFDVIHSARDNMIECMDEAFIVIDTNNCILDRNMSACAIFPKLTNLTPNTKLEDVSHILHMLFSKNKDSKFRNDGHYYETHINKIYNQNEIVGYSALIIDITSNHEYTKKLISMKREAEKANQTKSMFLANISHEIRTPLNAVMGMTDLILNEDINEVIQEDVLTIKSASNTLLKLIDEVLDLSKIESGKMSLKEERYQLSQIIHDVIRMTKLKLGKKPVVFTTMISKNLPEFLYGDETRIRQIFLNLLSNAAKFTQSGEIKLMVDCICEGNRANLQFTVTDTGSGIEKQDLSKIFLSFERAKKAVNDGIEGTGLGLAISKKIIDAMGGTIEVESTFGIGSSFTVQIPQRLSTLTYTDEELIMNSLQRINFEAPDASILAVDDNVLNLKVICSLLQQYKIEVIAASSGKEALELLKQRAFDLVFLDYMMPDLNGSETLAQIRKLSGCNETELPVVVLTANAISGIREELIKEGFTDYLSKPINIIELVALLKQQLPENKWNIMEQPGSKQSNFKKNTNIDGNSTKETSDTLTLSTSNSVSVSTDINCITCNVDSCLFHIKGDCGTYSNTEICFDVGLQNCANIMSYYHEAIQLYCSDNHSIINALHSALSSNNLKAFEIHIHGIKSASKTLGAISLSEQADALERAANQNDFETISNSITKFFDMNASVLDAFLDYLTPTLLKNAN